MITKNSIERLKQTIDIVEVVGTYVELRRAGVNYIACCPFHNEKTPSFVVSPQKGYYKCYGCGVGGDSISFIMAKEHVEFYEAVEKLASLYSFTLDYDKQHTTQYDYNNLLDEIVKYYRENLNTNDKILTYLQERGITSSMIEKFNIGYIGDNKSFIAFLNKNNFPLDKLLELGLIGKKTKEYYSKFFQRIMFPIQSPNGKFIGFGGRTLSGENAKYINSSQSHIFNKSQILYGYNLAKENIFKKKQIIITEGYIDTIMMHQAGFNNAVATLGTALTKEHLPLLNKGEIDIILCYDGDKAGINAALKASHLLLNKNGGVVIFKDNQDPADMIKDGKIQELINLINNPTPFIEFNINLTLDKYDLSNPLHKERALQEILSNTSSLSTFLKEEYKQFIATKLNISPNLVYYNTTIKEEREKLIIKEINKEFKIVEDVIIKSIAENKQLLNLAIEYIGVSDFVCNAKAFKSLLEDNELDSELIGIILNPQIKSLDIDAFREQLRLFILKKYLNKLNYVKKDKMMGFKQKRNEIENLNNKINLLKSGILVKI